MSKSETYNLYNGEVELVYNDSDHSYRVDDEIIYGVTSITGSIAKPALINWAVKLTKEKTKDIIKEIGWKKFSEDLDGYLYQAGGEHYRVSKETRELGTRVHDIAKRWQTKDADYQKLTAEMLQAESDKERLSYIALLKFFDEYDLEPSSLESKCYSKKYGYAGTIDYEGMVNGKYTIMDYKTSGGIYESYYLQATAYAQAKKEEGVDVEQTAIVRVAKDGELEVEIVKDWEKYLEPFLGALKVKEFLMEMRAKNFSKSKN